MDLRDETASRKGKSKVDSSFDEDDEAVEDTDMNRHRESDEDSGIKLYVGLEFESEEAAHALYTLYGSENGFTVRMGQLYRSTTDGSVISRRYVCSKEGFQTNLRTGCPALIKVNKLDSGKWALVKITTEHNHDLDTPVTQRQATLNPKSPPVGSSRTRIRSSEDPSSVIDHKRLKREAETEPIATPYRNLSFTSATDAYKFYLQYAVNMGFKVRIRQLFRSEKDGSITCKRFVCSKEGYQHPSRLGCGAFMGIQRDESGNWVVERLSNDHNHALGPSQKSAFSLREEISSGLETNGFLSLVLREKESVIKGQLYGMLFDYFKTRQANETGFFYATHLDENRRFSNVFWADGRSRFSCAQFGDAIIFDTSYRRGSYTIPFAYFLGVNRHRQPVLLGCALMSDESEESFTWVFQAWVRAMSGRRPVSIIADQDKPIQNSIAQVFPGTHHRFSPLQILAKLHVTLEALRSMDEFEFEHIDEFKFEYEACISQSKTDIEFDSAWNLLVNRYNLQENVWLKEMYRMRKSWVPFYVRGVFFAGIPVEGNVKSYFERFIRPHVPVNDFVTCYEKAVQHHRQVERLEDLSLYNSQPVLLTRIPFEEQCRELYTTAVFKIFQKELLESYNYAGSEINMEGAITKYLVQRSGNGDEGNTVDYNASNLDVSCSCRMFEFEGILCRHALKVFQIMNIREIPSRYILHRWMKSAKNGILHDVSSAGGSPEKKSLMIWSLREEACNYIDAGSSASIETFNLALKNLQEGREKVCLID